VARNELIHERGGQIFSFFEIQSRACRKTCDFFLFKRYYYQLRGGDDDDNFPEDHSRRRHIVWYGGDWGWKG
jgi:hypothetical protein